MMLISQRLSDLRQLLENKKGRRITDEELASLFQVSKSSIGNWKRDMVKALLPETERRFQELKDHALNDSEAPELTDTNGKYPQPEPRQSNGELLRGTVDIVVAYIERSPKTLSPEELNHLIQQVRQGLAG